MNKKTNTTRRQPSIKLVLRKSTERMLTPTELVYAHGGVVEFTSGTTPCGE